MDEYVIKQKIQEAYFQPRPPEELVQRVILRAKAVTMGTQAQTLLETAPAEKVGQLASRALIGKLALVSDLPKDADPEQLAHQLEQQPAFRAALRGGNIVGRLNSGDLLRQVTGQSSQTEQESSAPVKDVPKQPGMG